MSETTAAVTAADSPAGPAVRGTGVAESAGTRGRRARIALRGLQIVLTLFFGIASALPKLIGHSSAAEVFDEIGWGSVGMYGIGVLELAGAVALLVPVLQSVAAVALSGLMVGAFVFQLTVFDGENAATPLILIVPLALIAWARRSHNAELLRLVRRGA
ncbi:DoxX family protein [Streptomyces sp. enrichment culture]|uniref:DoxX family protein n=1 Tax=Streptomyces sp. enrichment culture TaxID=1795815 RepID=UPI003F550E96